MLYIYGTRNVKIKTYDDYHIKCDDCNGYGQRFSVYQQYAHIFYIPLCPSSAKTIKSACLECNNIFNEEQKKHYLSITRTPIYFFTGIFLFLALVAAVIIATIHTEKQEAEFVANPKINDVYLIKENANNYYFLKIKNIDADTIELIHSYFEYNGYVSKMDNADYFVSDDIWKVLKSDLKDLLEKGTINSVKRDYDKSSRFMIEKSSLP